ncbi:MAG: aldehyde dehydrogenase family protein, partial [Planctomycetes bacterium]|nr:aldehyde dehydrogenase family protein [Planctomycetota bacterium]
MKTNDSTRSGGSKAGKAGGAARGRRGAARELNFGGVWSYAPAPEATEVAPIPARQELFVGGAWTKPMSGRYFATTNPATEAVLGEVAHADARDVAAAVKAAAKAFPAWRKLPGDERARYLYRVARILQERAREFAVLETLDNGKPIKETRDVDVPLAAQHFFHHAGWADKLDLLFPGQSPEPLGVVGQVIPWNFPLLMAAWKLAPALAAGNTVVLKPAESSPLTALRLCEVFQQAGLPPGVVNVVTGGGATGAALVRHPGLAKVAFTGSTEVGKEIQRTLAGSGRELTLELGGKAAHIVCEDAALDQAVEGVVRGIFFNQGHVCCAGSRLLVQEGVHDAFVQKLARRMAR